MDAEHQVITAADVTTNAPDALNYTTMLDRSAANTGVHPKQALVDAGRTQPPPHRCRRGDRDRSHRSRPAGRLPVTDPRS